MAWQIRHQGSPKALQGLSLQQIVEGLRDGLWATTDEVRGPKDTSWVPIENHPQFAEIAEDLEPLPSRPPEEETRVDMNALIDVSLVLLIFFILTTSYVATVQKIVPLPTITDAKKGTRVLQFEQVKKYMIQVKVTGGDNKAPVIVLENEPVEVLNEDKKSVNIDKLAELIRPLVKTQPAKTEMLLDAQDVSWGMVISIQDAARSAGIRVIHHRHRPGAE